MMLTYGVSGIFALKKTIKQFLQPMIEQVLGSGGGGVDVPGGCVVFLRQLFRAFVFLYRFFFQFTDAFFWVDFTNIYIVFAIYYMYFIKKSNSVLATKFS